MKRILVVDDDASLRAALAKYLKRAGYEVVEAGDGGEALKVFEQAPADLVITDLIMPEREGIELIQKMRRRHPPVTVIAISGGGRVSAENYLSLAQALGAAKTLAKPFPVEVLLAAVKEVLPD